jgi:hypothetical protein
MSGCQGIANGYTEGRPWTAVTPTEAIVRANFWAARPSEADVDAMIRAA